MMKVAVVIDNGPEQGGGFYQSLSVIKALRSVSDHEFVFISTKKSAWQKLDSLGITTVNLGKRSWSDLIEYLFCKSTVLSLLARLSHRKSYLDRFFSRIGVDVVYFLSLNFRARFLRDTNYIISLWDLCHRMNPEFPEVRAHGTYEWREENYSVILGKAFRIIASSDVDKYYAELYYGINAERIVVLPFTVSSGANHHESVDYGISSSVPFTRTPYVLYPAQFWAHKNHAYIVEAFRILRNRNVDIRCVFVGRDKGTKTYVKALVEEYGLDDTVILGGFLRDEEIVLLYRNADALVMTTYFGPTNLPPLEAFYYGIPVIHGDSSWARKEYGDSCMYVDLSNPDSLANAISALNRNRKEIDKIVKKGKEKLMAFCEEDYARGVKRILDEYKIIQCTWKKT